MSDSSALSTLDYRYLVLIYNMLIGTLLQQINLFSEFK